LEVLSLCVVFLVEASFFAVSPAKPIIRFESRIFASLTKILGEDVWWILGGGKGDGEVDLLALQRGA
jgi:hypothetical protein